MIRNLHYDKLSDIVPADITQCVEFLFERKDLEDWQVRQAICAIQILCLDVLDRNVFGTLKWDEWLLASHSISPSHATLAREACIDDQAQPKSYGVTTIHERLILAPFSPFF